MFSENSRYKNTKEYAPVSSTGTKHKVKQIRYLPPYEAAVPYQVKDGDRLDHLSEKFYGIPTKFWLIADVNDKMLPHELINSGKKIIIPKESQ